MKPSVRACSLTPKRPEAGVGLLFQDPDCPSASAAEGGCHSEDKGGVQGAGPRQAGFFSSAHHLTTTVNLTKRLFTVAANEQWVRKQNSFSDTLQMCLPSWRSEVR